MSATITGFEPYISDDEVVSRMPGMTKGNLAQLRYTGKGPKFYKPSPRVVLYKWSDEDAIVAVVSWQSTSKRIKVASIGVDATSKNPCPYALLLEKRRETKGTLQ